MPTSRREALKKIATMGAFPLMVLTGPPRVEPLTPFQLNADGEGWARDSDGRAHPVHGVAGAAWVAKVTDLRLDGKKLNHCQEFNLEDGWATCMVDEHNFGKPGFLEVLYHGKVTVDWHRG